jgi:hypothetical protein
MNTRAVAALILVLFTVNCSTIVHQTTQQVKVDSEPAGAAVTVSCGDVFNDPKLTTPAVVTLHRKPAYCSLKLNKEGYAEKEVKFAKTMSPLYLGNVLIGGIVGLIVDAANGAMWNRTPAGEVKVKLDDAAAAATPTPGSAN